ncbi:GtrA family protein [Pseudomonas oryzihabitans]|uniref:GtrA family protein n=1 Tax=Pseudomonas oryzihabitans TaxID=47885 RepID=UPI002B1DB714|nr:GtrA family protein [Pseudomonas oryzihabitans]
MFRSISKNLLPIFQFGFVGAIGFLVDTGCLYLLKSALGIYPAKLISFFMAALTTWILNRKITFRENIPKGNLAIEASKYLIAMLGGGIINYSIFYVTTKSFDLFFNHPFIAVAAGSISGMAFNFIASKKVIYKAA